MKNAADVFKFVLETRNTSVTSTQRAFKIGYNRALLILNAIENAGFINIRLNEVLLPKSIGNADLINCLDKIIDKYLEEQAAENSEVTRSEFPSQDRYYFQAFLNLDSSLMSLMRHGLIFDGYDKETLNRIVSQLDGELYIE